MKEVEKEHQEVLGSADAVAELIGEKQRKVEEKEAEK
jgi:hypothetical protein